MELMATDAAWSPQEAPLVRLLKREGRLKILEILLRKPHAKLTVAEISQEAEFNPSTFHRNIDLLLNTGIVEKVGEESGNARYTINKDSSLAKNIGRLRIELMKYIDGSNFVETLPQPTLEEIEAMQRSLGSDSQDDSDPPTENTDQFVPKRESAL